MSCEVYANGRTIACKAADGKTAAAMPDVCLSPPSPPAGPLPVPYPNTAMASDTSDGSQNVAIGGKEIMLKDKSSFSKSTGDEAATKSFGMGVVSHQIQGKVNFVSWSMDVKVEGENVPRHMDMTLHNEQSLPANTPTWPYLDGMSDTDAAKCADDKDREEKACSGKTSDECCHDEPCQNSRKCMLVPYRPDNCCKKPAKKSGHHLIEVHSFMASRKRKIPLPEFSGKTNGMPNGKAAYSEDESPTVCATSPNNNWAGEHGQLHSFQGVRENFAVMTCAGRNPPRSPDRAWNYHEARQAGVDAHQATFKDAGCNPGCIAAQLDSYHKNKVGADDMSPLKTKKYGFGSGQDQKKLGVEMVKDLAHKRIESLFDGRVFLN